MTDTATPQTPTPVEPRAGLLFEHAFYTTGYQRADGPEPVTFEITEVTEDGKVYYGPAQRGIPTTATQWTWLHLFARDALGDWVGDRRPPDEHAQESS